VQSAKSLTELPKPAESQILSVLLSLLFSSWGGSGRRDLRVSDEEASERALDALDAVGLGDRGNAFPHQLSGGQQQRVAVARAVVAQPPLLIADEPTGNLDVDTSWEMMDLFGDIAAFGTAVLIATHNVEIVKRLQRRVVTLVHGRLVRDQPAGRTGRLAWLASS